MDKRKLTLLLAAVGALVATSAAAQPAPAQSFEVKAKQALLIDDVSGTILLSKSENDAIFPAALAKLMTMEVVFHALKEGKVTLDTEYKVSENAWRKGGAPSGGSTMFAALNSVIRLEDLIQGVIVQSANDGCIIIAEGLAGSEEKFADLMNARAKEIGLLHSHFRNSTGLPDPKQVTSVTDLVKLAGHLRREYPNFYHYYSQESFVWNKIFQRNRNPLLRLVDGATGWTRARSIVIPLLTPQLVISTVWLSYSTLTGLGVILAMTGGGPLKATQTLPMEMYTVAFRELEFNQALAIATFILILNALLTLAYVGVARRYEYEQ